MHVYIDIMARTVSALLAFLLIARFLGKQTVSNMTFHDFVSGITMGAIAANFAFNEKIPIMHFVTCLIIFTIISFVFSWMSLKSHRARKWISGTPTVVIDQGKIMEENMKTIKYTLDSLTQSLREKDIFNLEEVEYAILEPNGKISVKKKPEYQNVTRKDLNLPFPPTSAFPIELIMDGQIMEKNLKENGIKREWLVNQIHGNGKNITDVFYAVKASNGRLVFDYYQDHLSSPIDQE
ncbi:DUF421 domain-containing protein [Brevibacillus migulae]|uniref:DUF421 domain-containing protein n=1 Tax=Brevibacillus migulae TaxID=1644114 RepID=UPI00106ECC68|nr:DUF421 domain-containing protein [Brevibacillus migulae]